MKTETQTDRRAHLDRRRQRKGTGAPARPERGRMVPRRILRKLIVSVVLQAGGDPGILARMRTVMGLRRRHWLRCARDMGLVRLGLTRASKTGPLRRRFILGIRDAIWLATGGK